MGFNLKKYCESKLLRWLLPRLLSKKCGDRIAMSGEEAKMVDCYVIHLRNIGGELLYLVSGVDTEKNELYVNSLNPKDKTFSVPETIPLSSIFTKQITVNHYYKGFTVHYGSVYDLLVKYVTIYDVAKIKGLLLWEHLSQSGFNKKSLVNQDSIELLKFMFNNQLDSYDSQSYSSFTSSTTGISLFDLMTRIHSPRWINHPYSNRQEHKLEMHLESLLQSGDLKKDNSGNEYIVTGKALKSIEEYEKEERRHRDSVKMQRRIVWLTFIIALSTIAQAAHQYLFK